MRPGDTIQILVDNDDPWIIRYPGSDEWTIIVLASMGAVFLFFGILCICVDILRNRKRQKLISSGIRITARIVDIRENPDESLNG